jgi:trk system potassium uptake protein TrkA
MKIVIVGAGLVGTTLAEKLSRDGHDVSLVEADASKARELLGALDIEVIDSDEVNMIVALLASARFGVSRIVVRLHDAGHAEAFSLIRRNQPGDLVCVHPEQAAVDRIASLLAVHGAVDVLSFMEEQLVVAGFRITESSDFVGLRVSDMNLLFAATPTLAVAIHRMDDWIIPDGDEEIRTGDLVYFAIARDHLSDVLSLVGVREDQRRDVMIAGAGPIGLELARRLEALDVKVVLIEEDEALAREASEELDEAMVIHGLPTDRALLEEEDISRVASFVAVTHDHETNLVAGLLAKRLGAGRAIVLVDNPALVDLVGQIGIDAIISPRVLAIGLTLETIRGGRVRSVAQLLEDRIEIVEAEAAKRSQLTSGLLSDVKLPRGVLVGAVRRGEKLLVPQGSDRIEPGDRVLFITTSENAPKLADFLSE